MSVRFTPDQLKNLTVVSPPKSRKPRGISEKDERFIVNVNSPDVTNIIFNSKPVHLQDNAELTGDLKGLVITLMGLPAGLNGKNGLMRKHWTAQAKVKQTCLLRIQALPTKTFDGMVRIYYTGYACQFKDWDNFCSSAKFWMDSLVKTKIITDDSPKVVVAFIPNQIKVFKRAEQRVEILIEPI